MTLSRTVSTRKTRTSRRPRALTRASFARGLAAISESDSRLRRVLAQLGPPPTWSRPPGFATLVFTILEQQVSLASANAAFARLRGEASPLTPERFLELDLPTLRAVGFSRQKIEYCRCLAQTLISGALDLSKLDGMTDDEAKRVLMAQKGIGRWSADIYLLHALGRSDIWPVTDLALAVSVREILGLRKRPTPEKLETIGEKWRPWRAVAARIFWHAYLSKRGRSGAGAM
jgi:DNA-3-methyladenine glycosylase II